MTNNNIYFIAKYLDNFAMNNQQYLPARLSFYLMKNIQLFISKAQELEQMRAQIVEHYGYINEKGNAVIEEKNKEKAQQELDDLLNTEQEIEYKKIPLSWFDDVEFTIEEMNKLSFMIEDDL